jgi:DNA-binding SARP family transcriptional activator/tetratricopeptide (TPR) repeat protein
VGLLGYLAIEQRAIARDFLAAFFWPDVMASKGRANLSRELHNLAQILPNCWQSDRKSVSFIPSDSIKVDLYDIMQFEVQERWGEAAELLGGEFLEGLLLPNNSEFELWLSGERERWRIRSITILKRIVDGHTIRGRYDDALHNAQCLLKLAPWDEGIHRQTMRLLAWTGRRGAALRQFETCKQTLIEELDVEPADATIVLYQQIQAGTLSLPPQLPAFLSEEKARRKFERPLFVGREAEMAQLDGFLKGVLAGRGRVVFITGGPGQGKTALMEAFAQRAMENNPSLLVASGRCNAYSGLGDPFLPFRIVMAMLTGDVESRWDVGGISLDHAQRLWDAFSLIVQILLDHGPELLDVLIPGEVLLSRLTAAGQEDECLLPRLRQKVSRRATGAENVEQSQFFQQVTNVLRVVATSQPLLLILDDIQWADTASISLLFHLGRQFTNAESRILIICAYRPEEVAIGREGQRHPLSKVISEFKRTFGDGWMNLGQAEESKEREFVNALVDAEPNRLGPAFRSVLFDRTRGHPLFTVELLRAMQGRGELIMDEADQWIEGPALDWEIIPERAEAIIEERIQRLSPDLQEILTMASVEGELFTAQVLAEAYNVPEISILRRLSQELERRHRLVIEQEEVYTGRRRLSRFRFRHILYQDYLYKRLGQGERRLLHEDVAEALEKLYDGQLDEIAVQLAHHFQQAGDHGSACRYYAQAGERATRFFESRQAVTHYTRAIELAEKVFIEAATLARLHYGRGLAYERLGDFGQAQTDLMASLRIAREACENQIEADALLDLGRLWASRDHNQARDYFKAALDLARRIGTPITLAKTLNWMGNWHLNDDNFQRALAFHREALEILGDLGARREVANTLDLMGIANLMGGDLNSSVSYYGQAVVLCRELDDRLGLASSLLGRASAASLLIIPGLVASQRSPDPMVDIREAHRIAEEIGSASNRIWVNWSLGLYQSVRG